MIPRKLRNATPYLSFSLLGAAFFPSTGRDDVHITFWAAHTLSSFGEILNYNGERVEQSSSLLQTLILGLIGFITHFNMVDIGVYVSVFFGLLTIYLTGRLSLLICKENFLSEIFVATSIPLLYWSFGALETSIVSAAILFLLITTIKFSSDITPYNYLMSVITIALYLLVRPEAFFVLILFLFIPLSIFFFRREKYLPFLILFITTNVLFITILLLRYSYFGAFFPQPVEAKIGTSIIGKVHSGIFYYGKSLVQYPLFIMLALPVASYMTIKIRDTIKNKDLMIIISLLFTYSLFILSSGGDWMEGARFFVPVIGPSAIIAGMFYPSLVGKSRTIRYGVFLNLICLLYFATKFSTSYPIIYYKKYLAAMPSAQEFSFFETANRVHYRDIPLIVELDSILEKLTSKGIQPIIMSMQAGMVPYHIFKNFYRKARFVDVYGLSTRDFTQCETLISLPKNSFGISMDYRYFFSHIEKLQETCGIVAPDIVYDLDVEALKLMNFIQASGYTIVYLQTGEIGGHDALFKGGYVGGTQFIAVKNDIVHKFKLEKQKFRFK